MMPVTPEAATADCDSELELERARAEAAAGWGRYHELRGRRVVRAALALAGLRTRFTRRSAAEPVAPPPSPVTPQPHPEPQTEPELQTEPAAVEPALEQHDVLHCWELGHY